MKKIQTTSTELERKAFEADQNRLRLTAYYQKAGRAAQRPVRVPFKHAHLFAQGRVMGGCHE